MFYLILFVKESYCKHIKLENRRVKLMQILLICDIADSFQGAARGPHKKLDQLMHNSTEKVFFFTKNKFMEK